MESEAVRQRLLRRPCQLLVTQNTRGVKRVRWALLSPRMKTNFHACRAPASTRVKGPQWMDMLMQYGHTLGLWTNYAPCDLGAQQQLRAVARVDVQQAVRPLKQVVSFIVKNVQQVKLYRKQRLTVNWACKIHAQYVLLVPAMSIKQNVSVKTEFLRRQMVPAAN